MADRLTKRKTGRAGTPSGTYEEVPQREPGASPAKGLRSTGPATGGVLNGRRSPRPRSPHRKRPGEVLDDDLDHSRYSLTDWFLLTAITAVSAALRFWCIWHPAGVVFDEVHFGKFASYYLRREFFFDVHPPLAKLLLAFAGWVIGYDGHFEFENIGDSYVENNVPYIGLRALPAILGSLTPPLVYGIMKESGYPSLVSALTAALIAFDNGHIVQTRLILLDAPLVLFMAAAIFCYIKFYKLRGSEFSRQWWIWLSATGLSLALTISCKMVGLFTFMTIGTAVVIDLWNLLDIRRGYTMQHVGRHFAARFAGLIVLPSLVYLFWFWVHFAVLIKSGPGDDFMTPAFQETLIGSPLTLNAEEIRYNDTILLQHRGTKGFLHSHPDQYPLKYDDGRISSQGQQVTCYPHNDSNNHWIIMPTKELPSTSRGNIVRHKDVVRLLHPLTDSYLLTHDVASPLMATNQEFTTTPANDDSRYNESTFQILIDGAHEGQQFKTKSSHFQLLHMDTGVVMWTHVTPPLPDWAYKQQEVNGHKNLQDKTSFWVVDEIIRDDSAPAIAPPDPEEEDEDEEGGETKAASKAPKDPKARKHLNFFRKFFELQLAMLQHNAGLTDSHPYASGPINWPLLLSGISFWTGPAAEKQQVYMIGNVIGWWLCFGALSVIAGVFGADQFARRRGLNPIEDPVRNRLYNSAGFFVIAWACHYFPFFLMARQRFLHHYLPAHLCSALVAGAVFDFVITDTINYPVSVAGPNTHRRPKSMSEVTRAARIAAALLLFLVIISFHFLAPLTYGQPGLEPEEVNRRRVLSSWTLHFAK